MFSIHDFEPQEGNHAYFFVMLHANREISIYTFRADMTLKQIEAEKDRLKEIERFRITRMKRKQRKSMKKQLDDLERKARKLTKNADRLIEVYNPFNPKVGCKIKMLGRYASWAELEKYGIHKRVLTLQKDVSPTTQRAYSQIKEQNVEWFWSLSQEEREEYVQRVEKAKQDLLANERIRQIAEFEVFDPRTQTNVGGISLN